MKPESSDGMRVAPEEEIFDDMSPEDLARSDSEKGRVLDEEKGVVTEEEPAHGQAPAAAPNGDASDAPPTLPPTPPPAAHEPQEKVIEMSKD